MSLPGGELEGDETVAEAALREAGEKVGLESESVRVLGSLSTLYVPVSDFALHPVVGIFDERPAWRPEIHEVDRLLGSAAWRAAERNPSASRRVPAPRQVVSSAIFRSR